MTQFISLNPPWVISQDLGNPRIPAGISAGCGHGGVAPLQHSSCLSHCCSFWPLEYLTGARFLERGNCWACCRVGPEASPLSPLQPLSCAGWKQLLHCWRGCEPSQSRQCHRHSHLSPGISVSSLSDNLFVLHVHCEDNKQKVLGAHPSLLQGAHPPGRRGWQGDRGVTSCQLFHCYFPALSAGAKQCLFTPSGDVPVPYSRGWFWCSDTKAKPRS